MRKLIIQIPAWNEELTIFKTIQALPKNVTGFDRTEVLVIDDGSSDKTVLEAQRALAHHIIKLEPHQGLAAAFQAGIRHAVNLGASVILNTDADNQYQAKEINQLVKEIEENQFDLVVGDRNASKLDYLPWWKRTLYRLAAGVVSASLGRWIPDPTSGFRAFSRSFAKEISLSDRYSYTLESLIQACLTGRKVKFIPIKVNQVTRPSRLIQNIAIYILRTTFSFLRALWRYGIEAKIARYFFPEKVVLEEPSQTS